MSTASEKDNVPNKPLFRADEVAHLLGLKVRTIYNWQAEGKIEGVNHGGRCLRFPRHEVVRFVITRQAS